MTDMGLAEFAAEARAFLDAHAQRKSAQSHTAIWGEGSDSIPLYQYENQDQEREARERAARWRAIKFDGGFGWLSGPVEYGGRELSAPYNRVWRSIEAEYDVPNEDVYSVSLGMVGPTILAHGSDLAKETFLRKMYRGDILACQLFSEPGAGSDLASLQTFAARDGDNWVVDGQKVWTSVAHLADIGLLLARTDRQQPKHRGITAFIIDMKQPAVEIRPIRQMDGSSRFNEVFLNHACLPDIYRLGEINDGWRTARTTLGNERATIGTGRDYSFLVDRLVGLAQHFGCADDPALRQELMNVVIGFRVADLNNQRALARAVAGQVPGTELSIAKQFRTLNLRRAVELAARILGPRIIADTGEWGTWPWAKLLLAVPGQRIGGGTDEILKNVLAERMLGLPREPMAEEPHRHTATGGPL